MTLRVIPAPGRLVRYPADGRAMPATGGTVPDDVYWRRRIQDKDVLAAPDTAASAAAPTTRKRKG